MKNTKAMKDSKETKKAHRHYLGFSMLSGMYVMWAIISGLLAITFISQGDYPYATLPGLVGVASVFLARKYEKKSQDVFRAWCHGLVYDMARAAATENEKTKENGANI